MTYQQCTSVLFWLSLCTIAAAGPYDNPGVSPSEIRAWANEVTDFAPTASSSMDALKQNGLGRPDNALVSLGDLDQTQIANADKAGSITLSLPYAIMNGDGWDFAVFENASLFFTDPFIFAELAYVEVSSNGTDFLRFPSISLNVEPGAGNADTEINAEFRRDFAGVNTTNISNLAGIHPSNLGTTFDLNDLLPSVDSVDIDLNAIEYIRIVDVPGNGSFLDSEGRGILDAWPTTGNSSGFDLDAVGGRNLVPEPGGNILLLLGLAYFGWLRRR